VHIKAKRDPLPYKGKSLYILIIMDKHPSPAIGREKEIRDI
jgi:hypothetical protein